MASITNRYYDFIASWISDGDPRGLKPVILWIVNGDTTISQIERDEKDRALNAFNSALYAYNQAEKEVYNDIGEKSVAPIIIDGFWAFWDSELREFVKSEFSAGGDDGHSPYIDILTRTWWQWDSTLGRYTDTGINAEGEGGINVMINTQGSFRTYWKHIDSQGNILPTPEKVSEIVGGVVINGVKYIQCKVYIYKGSVDVTASALADPTTLPKWYLNNQLMSETDTLVVSIIHADGVDDEVRFEYTDTNAKNWKGA